MTRASITLWLMLAFNFPVMAQQRTEAEIHETNFKGRHLDRRRDGERPSGRPPSPTSPPVDETHLLTATHQPAQRIHSSWSHQQRAARLTLFDVGPRQLQFVGQQPVESQRARPGDLEANDNAGLLAAGRQLVPHDVYVATDFDPRHMRCESRHVERMAPNRRRVVAFDRRGCR